MDKSGKVLFLALALPLALYGIPYAYASTTTSTYMVIADYTIAASTSAQVYAACHPGDFATGGGYATFRTVTYSEGYPRTGMPTLWAVTVAANGITFTDVEVNAICMTPITVAGIGVPEFGSLYAAIALAAILYFGLTALRQRHSPTMPTPVST
jgi:hypothetical protein